MSLHGLHGVPPEARDPHSPKAKCRASVHHAVWAGRSERMTEDSAHLGLAQADPARRGGTIGAGLVPDEVAEGRAEAAAHAAGNQPDEGLVEPGGVDTEDTR
jgi:hypothetical protein